MVGKSRHKMRSVFPSCASMQSMEETSWAWDLQAAPRHRFCTSQCDETSSHPSSRTSITCRHPLMRGLMLDSLLFKSTQLMLMIQWVLARFTSPKYCAIIFIHWTWNFVYFVGKEIHEFHIPMKYLLSLEILDIILNIQIQMSTNISVFNPRHFVPYDFTVYRIYQIQQI